MAIDLELGDFVYFFQSVYEAEDTAKMALVTKVYPSGVLCLAFWDGMRWVPREAVHHRGSQVLKDNPMISRQFGCWDFRPRQRREIADEVLRQAAATGSTVDKESKKTTSKA